MTSLNPVFRIEKQIGEAVLRHHPHMHRDEVRRISIDMLRRVGIPNPEERIKAYPFQLSGGLRQRAMIAIALVANPALLIADEPTTALDVTIQAQIIDLLKQLQAENGMSILLITHDFGVVSQIADRVAVMYAGRIVEVGTLEQVFKNPMHPYTKLLILSIPGISIKRGQKLEAIPGSVPNPLRFPAGCRFHPRCPYATERCAKEVPARMEEDGHVVFCHLAGGDMT